jgi:hypothetical protein
VAAVVTVVVLGVGGIRARGATPAAPKTPRLTTTAPTRAPDPPPTTTVTEPRATPSTRPRTSTSTSTSTTSTTTEPAPLAAGHRPTRATCLALADANHYRVVAANETWLLRQLHGLAARHLLAGPQARALRIEEAQAQSEIEAQYAIDRSNCYLG